MLGSLSLRLTSVFERWQHGHRHRQCQIHRQYQLHHQSLSFPRQRSKYPKLCKRRLYQPTYDLQLWNLWLAVISWLIGPMISVIYWSLLGLICQRNPKSCQNCYWGRQQSYTAACWNALMNSCFGARLLICRRQHGQRLHSTRTYCRRSSRRRTRSLSLLLHHLLQ